MCARVLLLSIDAVVVTRVVDTICVVCCRHGWQFEEDIQKDWCKRNPNICLLRKRVAIRKDRRYIRGKVGKREWGNCEGGMTLAKKKRGPTGILVGKLKKVV